MDGGGLRNRISMDDGMAQAADGSLWERTSTDDETINVLLSFWFSVSTVFVIMMSRMGLRRDLLVPGGILSLFRCNLTNQRSSFQRQKQLFG